MEVLGDILRGGIEKADEAGVVVAGRPHRRPTRRSSTAWRSPASCIPTRIWRNVGARPGDALVLTKALGTGIVTTALKRGAARAEALRRRDRDHDDAERRRGARRCAPSTSTPAPTSPVSASSGTGSRWPTAAASGSSLDARASAAPARRARPRSATAARPAAAAATASGSPTSVEVARAVADRSRRDRLRPPDVGRPAGRRSRRDASDAVAALHAAGVTAATIIGAVQDRTVGPWSPPVVGAATSRATDAARATTCGRGGRAECAARGVPGAGAGCRASTRRDAPPRRHASPLRSSATRPQCPPRAATCLGCPQVVA